MNILLHICCAPCAIVPSEVLRKDGHRIAGLFYNPNIHPYSEYLKRKEALERYSELAGFRVHYGAHEMEEYFHYVVYNEGSKSRCPVCWWMRLLAAAKYAKENGFDAFTTTLLVSPYQDHETLKEIGSEVASAAGIKFYYQDFRPAFNTAQDRARELGLYRQNYCGCVFSEKEMLLKKAERSVRKTLSASKGGRADA
jgi:predicted adenine nucleotide alpha hydrolase (AANH) superfamily ATPase